MKVNIMNNLINKLKRKTKTKIKDNLPYGISAEKIMMKIGVIYLVPILYSMQFLIHFQNAKNYQIQQAKYAQVAVYMAEFPTIIYRTFMLFPVAMLGCLGISVLLYSYHFQGSKSIYVMKRLPDSYELWRRVFMVPVVSALLLGICAIVILALYYWYYINVSPAGSAIPVEWRDWLTILGNSIL